MDYSDRKILENELAVPVGKAISAWMKKNNIEHPVQVNATVCNPSCYIDESGVSHTGRLVVCNVSVIDDDDYDDED